MVVEHWILKVDPWLPQEQSGVPFPTQKFRMWFRNNNICSIWLPSSQLMPNQGDQLVPTRGREDAGCWKARKCRASHLQDNIISLALFLENRGAPWTSSPVTEERATWNVYLVPVRQDLPWVVSHFCLLPLFFVVVVVVFGIPTPINGILLSTWLITELEESHSLLPFKPSCTPEWDLLRDLLNEWMNEWIWITAQAS